MEAHRRNRRPSRALASGAILLASIASEAHEPTTIDLADGATLPTVIPTDADAARLGFVPAHLKDAHATEMVRDVHGFHADQILIYERRADGAWTLAENWCYPDWYGMGSSRLVRLFDDGRDQIRIDALGNTGTSTLQKFRLYVGWCGGAWHVLFCETTSYRLGNRTLAESFRWEGLRTARPSVRVSIAYDERSSPGADDELDYELQARWDDRLAWSMETCSFYDRAREAERAELGGLPGQRRIAALRLLAMRVAPSEFCDDLGPGDGAALWNALTDVIEATSIAAPPRTR